MSKIAPDISPFEFKQFSIAQDKCSMQVGTDGVLLGAWAGHDAANNALDIGTGSGLIALMLAQRFPQLSIDAVEIDPEACQQAAENFAASPFPNDIKTHATAIQDFAKLSRTSYDIIVSNPPFFSGGVLSDNPNRNKVRQTIKLPHGDLLQAVRKLLKPEGQFYLILPLIEGMRIREIATKYRLHARRVCHVNHQEGKPVKRLLMALSITEGPCEEEYLSLYQEDGSTRTEAYQNLVQEFYL